MPKAIILIASLSVIPLSPCLFQAALSQQPHVVAVSPPQNRIAPTAQPHLTATFSVSIDPSTITAISFSAFGERSGYKNGAVTYDATERRATFAPTTSFIAGERVTASLSRSITSQNGDSLDGFIWVFRIPSAGRNEVRFEDAVVYGGGGWSMQCVDMNNDGYADIVSSGGVIRLNNGAGAFNAFWTLPGADPFSRVAVDDFNRDGIMDVLYFASGLSIALSEGNGNFSIQNRPWWFDQYITGDFNSDGYPDIAGVTTSGDAWGISFNDGSGLFSDTVILGRVQGILTSIEAFDVDNDGHLDVLCAGSPVNSADEDGIAVWKGDGRGGFDGPDIYVSPIFSFPEQLYYSDFSNDGLADIAVRGYVGGLSLNLGGIFGTDTSSTREFWPAEAPGAMTGGDFNGDGWIDLVVSGWKLVPFDTTRFTGYAIIPSCKNIFRDCVPWPGWISDTLGYDYLVRSVQAVDIDNDGDLDLVHSYSEIYVNINTSPQVSVSEGNDLPRELHVCQNYPNPFNPNTTFRFDLPEPATVSLVVYDLLGRQIAEVVSGRFEAGYHSRTWNARLRSSNTGGEASDVASGVYLARFTATGETGEIKYSRTTKLILMK